MKFKCHKKRVALIYAGSFPIITLQIVYAILINSSLLSCTKLKFRREARGSWTENELNHVVTGNNICFGLHELKRNILFEQKEWLLMKKSYDYFKLSCIWKITLGRFYIHMHLQYMGKIWNYLKRPFNLRFWYFLCSSFNRLLEGSFFWKGFNLTPRLHISRRTNIILI